MSCLHSCLWKTPIPVLPLGQRPLGQCLPWYPSPKARISLSHFPITSLLSHVLDPRASASIWSANLCQNVNHSWFKSIVLSFCVFVFFLNISPHHVFEIHNNSPFATLSSTHPVIQLPMGRGIITGRTSTGLQGGLTQYPSPLWISSYGFQDLWFYKWNVRAWMRLLGGGLGDDTIF